MGGVSNRRKLDNGEVPKVHAVEGAAVSQTTVVGADRSQGLEFDDEAFAASLKGFGAKVKAAAGTDLDDGKDIGVDEEDDRQ
ncbi:MAG: hypothetical protein WC843_02225 [Candidatus Gracilibacteria bacterium]|jgi:hypothetical protein